MSWQYVNSMNYMTFGGVGVRGGRLSMGALSTHKIPNLSLAKHVHRGGWSMCIGVATVGL
jgi:hypothetical protein